MRLAIFAMIAIAAGLSPAQASIGFTCRAEDDAAKLVLSGAYGTGLGSGMANFGADIEIRHPDASAIIRRLQLAYEHVSERWFRYRDLKLMARWLSPSGGPNVEVLLIMETRRAEEEGSSYLGRYELIIYGARPNANSDRASVELSGLISCSID
jgi:hypothetical protein